ncbi:MAG TPA: hypothetical protein VMG13_07100, partial [Trebonia sp.]|nr:hypothetical protein [Trebonia sp.]
SPDMTRKSTCERLARRSAGDAVTETAMTDRSCDEKGEIGRGSGAHPAAIHEDARQLIRLDAQCLEDAPLRSAVAV